MNTREQILGRPLQPRSLNPGSSLPIQGLQEVNGELMLGIQSVSQIPFRQVFENTKTLDLYRLRDLIDKLISTRQDAKR